MISAAAPYLIGLAVFAGVLAWWINRKPAAPPDEPNDDTIDVAAHWDVVKLRYTQLRGMRVGVFKDNEAARKLIDQLIEELSKELLP